MSNDLRDEKCRRLQIRSDDGNNDGVVDSADYTLWRDNMSSITNPAADGNSNSVVDGDDYDVWKANFGNHSGAVLVQMCPSPSRRRWCC